MKKQYIFLLMLLIIVNILYFIGSSFYKEYQINSNIKYIENLIKELNYDIKSAKSIIEYKQSKAFKNKILKEQQSYKNNGEKVLYFTTEDEYEKYTQSVEEAVKVEKKLNEEELNIKEMSIYEKWMYFLFGEK